LRARAQALLVGGLGRVRGQVQRGLVVLVEGLPPARRPGRIQALQAPGRHEARGAPPARARRVHTRRGSLVGRARALPLTRPGPGTAGGRLADGRRRGQLSCRRVCAARAGRRRPPPLCAARARLGRLRCLGQLQACLTHVRHACRSRRPLLSALAGPARCGGRVACGPVRHRRRCLAACVAAAGDARARARRARRAAAPRGSECGLLGADARQLALAAAKAPGRGAPGGGRQRRCQRQLAAARTGARAVAVARVLLRRRAPCRRRARRGRLLYDEPRQRLSQGNARSGVCCSTRGKACEQSRRCTSGASLPKWHSSTAAYLDCLRCPVERGLPPLVLPGIPSACANLLAHSSHWSTREDVALHYAGVQPGAHPGRVLLPCHLQRSRDSRLAAAEPLAILPAHAFEQTLADAAIGRRFGQAHARHIPRRQLHAGAHSPP